MKIIIDVMGGDNAPAQILRGAVDAAAEFQTDLILVGNRTAIESCAKEQGMDISKFEIVHTQSVIEMDDDPLTALHTKKDSSMCAGLKLLAQGDGDAFVSAGNTGALFTAATIIVRKIPGIARAAIASVLPMKPPVLLLDSGANVTVTDEYLEQFAVMGNVYMRSVFGVAAPRVGLLNNGEEKGKGTQLQIDTYRRLSENNDINFVGNIEANRVPSGVCDILVTDGFTGNILLKSIEGMGKLIAGMLHDSFHANALTKLSGLLMKDKLKSFKRNFDPATHGGAPLLGLKHPVIKAHGSSSARALKNAVGQAINYSRTGVTDEITREVERILSNKKTGEI